MINLLKQIKIKMRQIEWVKYLTNGEACEGKIVVLTYLKGRSKQLGEVGENLKCIRQFIKKINKIV